MKSFFRILAMASAAVAFFACTEAHRNTEPLTDPWTRERTPVNVRLESQIGAAAISDNWRNDQEGSVHVSLITGALDMSKVKVLAVDFKFPDSEYCPVSSLKAGDTVDLTSGETTFTVTAYNGETRTYTLSYEDFTDPLEGVYVHNRIAGILDGNAPTSSMIVAGGWTDAYVLSTAQDKSWQWGAGYQPGDEEDNVVSFMLTAADAETGLTRGTIVNLAGEDGAYANYMFQNAADVNGFYRQIPVGSSRWAKDESGKVWIYAKEDEEYANPLYSIEVLGAGDVEVIGGYEKMLTVPELAFARRFVVENEVVDQNWPDSRWMRDNIRFTAWLMSKTSDSPVEGHADLF